MNATITTRFAALLTAALAATTIHADSFEELNTVGSAGRLQEAAGAFVPVLGDDGRRSFEQVFLLHGGYRPELDAQPVSDAWVLADGYWQHLGRHAPAMASHALVTASDGRAWAIGAAGNDGWGRPLDSLYAFTLRRTHGLLEVEVERVEVPGPAPRACFGITTTAAFGGGSLLAVGGRCLGNPLDPDPSQLWEYRIADNRWHRRADLPVAIADHSAAVARDFLWVFGGNGTDGLSNAVYRYDLLNDEWLRVSTQGTPPAPRRNHHAVVAGSHMLVFGGIEQGTTPRTLDDVWQLDLDTLVWTRKTALRTGLAGMAGAVAPTRLNRSGSIQVFVYGGLEDAWSFPPELSDRTMVYTSDVRAPRQRRRSTGVVSASVDD